MCFDSSTNHCWKEWENLRNKSLSFMLSQQARLTVTEFPKIIRKGKSAIWILVID